MNQYAEKRREAIDQVLKRALAEQWTASQVVEALADLLEQELKQAFGRGLRSAKRGARGQEPRGGKGELSGLAGDEGNLEA